MRDKAERETGPHNCQEENVWVRRRLDRTPDAQRLCWVFLMMIGLVAAATVDVVAAQELRTRAVPHYITALRQIDTGEAAAFCAEVQTDAAARREAAVISRLAREAFGEDVLGAGVPLKNSDGFVAPVVVGGKRSQAATFQIEYTGFSPEAKTAFQYAIDVWSVLIESPVPIRIEASWTALDFGILGSAGPDALHADFEFGVAGTWYPAALANSLAGEDLSAEYVDIVANFNSDFSSWYFGLDGATPAGTIDFVTVVMHEIGHGLGFFGTMDVDNGAGIAECSGVDGNGCWGFDPYPGIPAVFERFAEDADGNLLIDTNVYPVPSIELGHELTSRSVYFDGPAAVAAYGVRPPLYAPSTWNEGSSFSHLDESAFAPGDPSSLMTPSVSGSEAIHDPGAVGCGIFADIGWMTTESCGTGVVPQTPSIPVPLSPADNTTGVPVDATISWQPSLKADAYSLEVARTPTFDTTEVSVSGITETAYLIEGLEHGTEYVWHVRATNAQSTSKYSTTYRFTTAAAPPAAPVLTAPADGAAGLPTTVTLDWEAVTGADEYTIEIDSTAEFENPIHQLFTTDSEVALTGLVSERTYFWRVRAADDGDAGEWSETWTFTTIIALPAPPQPASPTAGAASVSIDAQLVWHSSARADFYEVVVASDSGFTSIEADSVLADTAYAARELDNNARYFWRVRGVNAAGAGAWSAVSDFRTIVAVPAVPRLVSPVNAARDLPTTITFRWQEAADADLYELELSTSLNFDPLSLSVVGIDTTVATVADLEFDTQYFWRVRAINPAGPSVFSSAFTFFTRIAPPEDVPELLSPADGADGLATAVTLAWSTLAGADSFRVQVSTDSTFAAGGVYADSTLASTSFALRDLADGATYYWRVSASNESGQGPWSGASAFRTQVARPAVAPLLLAPENGAVGLDRTVVFEWSEVASALRYELVVSSDSTFDAADIRQADLDVTSFMAEELEYATTYFWRVRGWNDGGDGPWSEVRRFATRQPTSDDATDAGDLPGRFALEQNYPNPFNPSTTFSFALPTSEHVRLEVMDISGRRVAVIVDRRMAAGRHAVVWSATGLPSGTYVYRLRAGEFLHVRAFVLLK